MSLQQYMQGRMDNAGPRIALRLENELRLAAPVNKNKEAKNRGDLRRSITVLYSIGIIKIFANDIIFHVIFATKPHEITPKNKNALAFKVGGKAIVVKKVMHPGTKANPFIQDILFRKLKDIIVEELNR